MPHIPLKTRIYLDNNATTSLAPEVFKAVMEAYDIFGNPSSMHSFGQEAKAKLLATRDIVAKFFHVQPSEVIFTSSGTEALNMVLRGLFGNRPTGHIITSAVEHAAVYNTVKALEAAGCTVSYLNPGKYGAITPEQIEKAIQADTKLVTLMAANNETGVKTDIEAVARLCEAHRIPFVVDGIGILGKELFTIPKGVSAICFSGHKIHAPKGVGAAIVRKSLKLMPYLTGGNQEAGRRAGTEDLAAIVGFGRALELLSTQLPESTSHMQSLRDRFEKKISAALPHVKVNGTGPRVANTSNLTFENIEGEVLLMQLDLQGVAASHGSACTTGALEPSRLLLNMGLTRNEAASSIRFSLSRYTTTEEIDRASDIVISSVQQLNQ